jgi:endogenous inhibitor of DNA gyrase (YacG/DUF329 family)
MKKEKNPNYSGGKDVDCTICGKSHYRTPTRLKVNRYYCSAKCRIVGASLYPNKPRKGKVLYCPRCGKGYYVSKTFIKTRKYCSYDCANKSASRSVELTCKYCKSKYTTTRGQVKNRGSKYCSRKCKDLNARLTFGENHYMWKGGGKSKRIRKGAKWKEWRTAVFERDDYTCQKCGDKSGKGNQVELHPHHVKQFAYYPDLRFDIDNGLTLCKDCHIQLHKEIGFRVGDK